MSTIRWIEHRTEHRARWHSESGTPQPARMVPADDRMTADRAYRLARTGTALLWRGDFHNARQLLQAMRRRAQRNQPRAVNDSVTPFQRERRVRSRTARVLAMLVVQLDSDHALRLRRAPDVRPACTEVYGLGGESKVVALTELLGVLGAHQWRVKGVEVPALGTRIHPHYGVFAPIRGEYIDLVVRTPLPDRAHPGIAFDLGTGTGVLAAVLAHRGFDRIIATDNSSRALACARDNIDRLRLTDRVEIDGPTLFPQGRADLVVCNPPWLPGTPVSDLERGVYDPDSAMLDGFLTDLRTHLTDRGEGWLILSDLAEHLRLRTRADLLSRIDAAGLRVLGKLDTRPRHPRAQDTDDPLHRARAAETTSLWRLTPR